MKKQVPCFTLFLFDVPYLAPERNSTKDVLA